MTTDERFDRIEALIERSIQSSNERFARIEASISRLSADTDERFARIEDRLDRIEERLDRMDERFERVDASIQSLSEQTAARFDAMAAYINDFRSEAISRLDMTDNRIGLMAESMAHIDPNARLPMLTKSTIDLGSTVSKFGIELWKQKDAFETRLAKLEETVAKLRENAA